MTGPLKPNFMDTQWGPKVWLSPDRHTLLAEWEFACDGHLAVFVPAKGGTPRIVTGERNWQNAVPSVPLGWTQAGLARVEMLRRWGPQASRAAGVYLFDPAKGVPKPSQRERGC